MRQGLLLACVLSGCGPDPWATTPPEIIAAEIDAHRIVAITPVRSANTCVGASSVDPPGWSEEITVRVRVSVGGEATLRSIGGTAADGRSLVAPACMEQIVRDAESWRYRPFEANGRPIAREFEEQVEVLLPERWRQDERPFPSVNDISEVRIILERWGCLGDCPSYRLELRGDGTSTFTGRRYVDEIGERHAAIDRAQFVALLQRFREARFYALLDEYATDVTDLPSYILTVEIGDQRARVHDYDGTHAGMPLVVRELEEEVDRVANSSQWIGRGSRAY